MKKLQWVMTISFMFLLIGVGNLTLVYPQDTSNSSSSSSVSIHEKIEIPLEEQTEEIKKRLKKLRERENLIEIARQAGFTDQELQEITIEDGGETINVWNYIIQEKERFKKARKAKEEASKKRYITVKDITDDLLQKETDQVSNLRENLIFSGEEE